MKYRTSTLVALISLALFIPSSVFAQIKYNLPHVVDGPIGGVTYRTTFILVNNSNASVAAELKLTNDSGKPLSVTLGGLGSAAEFAIFLDPGATGVLQTSGTGAGASGAAVVTATSPIGVSAVFTVYDAAGNFLSESGVGASDPQTEFMLPVDSTGFALTGLALFNPGVDALVTLTLLNTDGSQAGQAQQTLLSGNHTARFVATEGQLFPTAANFRGTLVVQSASPIAALVLRQYQSPSALSYTSLPVVPRSSSKLTLNLAHIANGSYGNISFKTSFLVFNVSSRAAAVTLSLTQDDGSPFTATIPGSGTGSSFNFSLAPGASVFLQTDGQGLGTSGAATVTSDAPVGASAIFTVFNPQGQFQTEAGVGDSPVLTSLTVPAYVVGAFDTGVAFYNPGNNTVSLSLKLMDSHGVLVNSKTQSLPARSHLARFATDLFPGTNDFIGSIAIASTAAIAATSLRQYASGATYTTLPITSGTAAGQQAIPPLLSQTVSDVSAKTGDPDTGLRVALPQGFLLAGTVTGPGRPSIVVAVGANNAVYMGAVDPFTGRYLIVVPAGTYTLSVWYQPAATPQLEALTVTYTDPAAVQVSGNTTKNLALPSVSLSSVSGTVSGLASFPSPLSTYIVFTSNDNTMQGVLLLDASGAYEGVLPSGNYVACITRVPIQFSLGTNETLEVYNIGALTVAGGSATQNYTVPATATLSGLISGRGLTSTPGASVAATDTSWPIPNTQTSCCTPPVTSVATTNLSGAYQIVLAQNRTYAMDIAVPLILNNTTLLGVAEYPVSPSPVTVGSDATVDFSLPDIPGRAIIFGVVTDSSGSPVNNVTISARSQSLTGAPNLGFSASGTTDANGNFSLGVLSGTRYIVAFTPPSPKP